MGVKKLKKLWSKDKPSSQTVEKNRKEKQEIELFRQKIESMLKKEDMQKKAAQIIEEMLKSKK